jgi:hypothetical protein
MTFGCKKNDWYALLSGPKDAALSICQSVEHYDNINSRGKGANFTNKMLPL